MEKELVIKLDDGRYIGFWFSDNEAGEDSEDCDSCIGYNLYNSKKECIDGGEMDYNSEEKCYDDITDVIEDIIEFVVGDSIVSFDYNIESRSIEEFESTN